MAAPGEALIVLLVCSTARRSFAWARLSEMLVERQTVNGVLIFLVNLEEKNFMSLLPSTWSPPILVEYEECKNVSPFRMESREREGRRKGSPQRVRYD